MGLNSFSILILTPFRNEDNSISLYLQSLKSVEYPRDQIDVYWLENDSTDKTVQMLKDTQPHMPFRKTMLKSVRIVGPVKKSPPGGYWKDLPYSEDRVSSWLVIWNQYFTQAIRESEADYALFWFADIVGQSNVIKEYLKVFKARPDAGWVGGAMHRRYPRHDELSSPWLFGRPAPAFENAHFTPPSEITEVKTTAHCWMMPRKVFEERLEMKPKYEWDWSMSITEQLRERGYKVYYQPSVYIQHISTDGRIYGHRL